MFTNNYQPGQQGRMGMMYNLQHQNVRQQQQATQHMYHSNLQQHHASTQSLNSGLLDNQNTYANLMSQTTPSLTPNPLQNGPSNLQNGQGKQHNEHWREQLSLSRQSKEAHADMIDRHNPNYYSRANNQLTTFSDKPGTCWSILDLSGAGLRIVAPTLFTSYRFLTQLYVSSNKLTELSPLIGELRSLSHLDASHNELTDVPPELAMCTNLKTLLLFDNYIRTLPYELGSLYNLEMLGIEGNPLDPYLKEEVVDKGTKSLISHLREEAPMPAPPPPRQMLELQDSSTLSDANRLRVFSFNILCDNYANAQQYPYTATRALDWDYRKNLILQEIQAQDPDIICLQEINLESFEDFFSSALEYAGYKGIFYPKGRAKTMSEKNAKIADGCATFYRERKFVLLDKQLINFANIAINRPDMKNQHDIFNRVGPRDDIAVVTFFENRMTGARQIVVNTHIFWNPEFADVKLIQSAILMENVAKLSDKYARWPATPPDQKRLPPKPSKDNSVTDGDGSASAVEDEAAANAEDEDAEPAPSQEYSSGTALPLILCTDLNSLPSSSVFSLLSSGHVPPTHPELGSYQYGHFTRDGISHPFSLRSAYSLLDGSADEMPFTNYTASFRGVIDHVWYSTNSLEVVGLLGAVEPSYLRRIPGFPTWWFPSDHLPLCVEIGVKSQGGMGKREGMRSASRVGEGD